MKPKIFIGSSNESIKIAKLVQKYLGEEYECVIWNNHFFDANIDTYANLAKKAIIFDYAIFIGGPDDLVFRRSNIESRISPRDNVYLEFGLYAGILSPARSYFLIDKKCTIASDLRGITIFYYSGPRSIRQSCDNIKDKIQAESRLNRIKLLPSTSLAVGYFENFLSYLEDILPDISTIEVSGKSYFVKDYPRSLKIVIPEDISEDWKSWAFCYKREHNLQEVVLPCRLRKIGMLVDCNEINQNHRLHLIDAPQTLRASFQAVDLVMGIDYIGETTISEIAKEKEVDNFISTLGNLIRKTSYLKKITTIVREK